MSVVISTPPRKHLLSVAEYHSIGELGILGPNVHCELIDGEIIDMSPIGSRHAGVVRMLNQLLNQALRNNAVVSIQDPVALDEYSEPQPDITLVKPRTDFYKGAHPRAEDVLLVVEVADSSLRYDRDIKIPLYAKSGIYEVWLVDLQSSRIEIFQNPAANEYHKIWAHDLATPLAPAAMPEYKIDVSSLFA